MFLGRNRSIGIATHLPLPGGCLTGFVFPQCVPSTSLRPRFHRIETGIEEMARTPDKRAEPETVYTIRLGIEFDQEEWEKAK